MSALGAGTAGLLSRDYDPRIFALDEQSPADGLEKLAKYKSLINHVVHDVRTLMRGILGSMELLLEGDHNSEAIKEVSSSLDMLSGLLEIVVSNEYQFSPENLNLRSVLMEILTPLGRLFPNIKFEVNIPEDINFDFDRVGVCRIAHNLAKNAFEAVASHHAEDAQGKVLIQVAQNDETVAIAVQDNGPGIPAERLDSLFKIRFSTKTGLNPEGRGLGLGNVSGMVAVHNGIIQVMTTVGQGTTFLVNLPAKQDLTPTAAKPATPDEEQPIDLLNPDMEGLLLRQKLVRHVIADIRRLMQGIRNKLAKVAAINTMQQSVIRISQLLEIILSGAPKLSPTNVPLKKIVDEIIELLSESYPDVNWNVKIADDLTLNADPLGIYRVIHNLALNACEALEKSSTPAEKTISIRGVITPVEGVPTVNLIVKDNGPGIAEDNLVKIFDSTFTTQGSTKDGRGLGLYHVMQVTAEHGGIVEAQSEGEGQGATFHVKIPVNNRPTPVTAAPVNVPEDLKIRLGDCTLVLLEDDPDTAHLLAERTFAKIGIKKEHLLEAATYQALVKIFESLEVDPAKLIVVSDVNFPGGTVADVIEMVRKLYPTAKLVINSNAMEADEVSGYQRAGADDAITKPITTDDSRSKWIEVLARLLANEKAPQT